MSVFRRAAGATRSSMLGAWSCYIPISAFEVWIFSLMRTVCPSDNRYLSHGRHPLSGARCATTIKVRLVNQDENSCGGGVTKGGQEAHSGSSCPSYRLEEMLSNVTPEAMRAAFQWDAGVGREVVEDYRHLHA